MSRTRSSRRPCASGTSTTPSWRASWRAAFGHAGTALAGRRRRSAAVAGTRGCRDGARGRLRRRRRGVARGGGARIAAGRGCERAATRGRLPGASRLLDRRGVAGGRSTQPALSPRQAIASPGVVPRISSMGGRSPGGVATLLVALALVVTSTAAAARIVGTDRADVLRGTTRIRPDRRRKGRRPPVRARRQRHPHGRARIRPVLLWRRPRRRGRGARRARREGL